MKPGYHVRIGETSLAVLDLIEYFDDGYLITRINVPSKHRGQGYGRRLMTECLEDADKEGIKLRIECSPYPDCPMTRDQLKGWYERCGFRQHTSHGLMLIRRPKG